MEKTSATPEIRRRSIHLAAMAAGGTSQEKTIAAEKIRRLEATYDFSQPKEEAEDIFSGWTSPKSARVASPLLRVDKEWLDAGNLIKWVFQEKFQTSSSWRSLPTGAELRLEARAEDVKRLKAFAQNLLETIIAACVEFSPGPNVRELERAPFLSGLYDGLMNEQRPAGAVMPGYSPAAKKKTAGPKKAKTSGQPAGNAATIHPYDIGHSAGKKLRLNIPRDQLCEEIRLAVNGAEASETCAPALTKSPQPTC